MEKFLTTSAQYKPINALKTPRRSSLSLSASSKKKIINKQSTISTRDEQLLKIFGINSSYLHNNDKLNKSDSVNELSKSINLSTSLTYDEVNINKLNYEKDLFGSQLQWAIRTPPESAIIISNKTFTTPPKKNPHIVKIQKDLNSPSANARIRALRALKSQTQINKYCRFDVPREEQDIITAEERRTPPKPRSIQEVMKDVVVYVEVRTGGDNRSSGIKKVIELLGATVNDKFLRNTTHVIFKDGLLSTYNKAKKWDIPIVSILWIEATKKHLRLANPIHYPILNIEKYENPDIYKLRKYRSMQPDASDKVKVKKQKPAELTEEKKSYNKKSPKIKDTENKLDEILREFQDIIGTPDDDPEIYPVHSKLLERIKNIQFENSKITKENEICDNNSISSSQSVVDFTPPPHIIDKYDNLNCVRKSLFQNSDDYKDSNSDTSEQQTPIVICNDINVTRRLTRRNSMLFDSNKDLENKQTNGSIHKSVSMDDNYINVTRRLTRRNSMLFDSNKDLENKQTNGSIHKSVSMDDNDINVTRRLTRRNSMLFDSNKDLENKQTNVSIHKNVSMDLCSSTTALSIQPHKKTTTPKNNNRRKTVFEFTSNTIIEEELNENIENNNPLFLNITTQIGNNKTKTDENDERTTKKKRQTTYTPKSMDKTNIITPQFLKKSLRRTLYTPKNYYNESIIKNNNQENLNLDCSVITPIHQTPKLNDENSIDLIKMPETPKNLNNQIITNLDILEKTPIFDLFKRRGGTENNTNTTPLACTNQGAISFNSARKPVSEKRRTIYDYSRDIIENRLNEINRYSKKLNETINNLNDQQQRSEIQSNNGGSEISSKAETRISSVNFEHDVEFVSITDKNNKMTPPTTTVLSQGKQVIMDSFFKHLSKTPPLNVGNKLINKTLYNNIGVKKRKLYNPSTSYVDLEKTITPQSKKIIHTQSEKKRPRLTEGDDDDIFRDGGIKKKLKTDFKITSSTTIKNKNPKQISRRSTLLDFDLIKSHKTNNRIVPVVQPCIVYTNMHREQINVIKEAVKKLGVFKLEDNVTKNTTHLITLESRRTINILKGIIHGVWILRYEWLLDSIENGNWLCEEQYELTDFSRAVAICRAERQLFGNKYKIDIFMDIGPIYISSYCNIEPKKLRELILLCSGKIVNNKNEGKYIIGEKFQMEDKKLFCVDPLWILDCISNYKIMKISKYLLKA